MKKYFLLATTALLLGANNVLAQEAGYEDPESTTVNIQVSVTVKSAATFETNGVMDFGTIYVDKANVSAGDKLASFTNGSLIKENKVVHHDGESTPATVTASFGDASGATPVFKNVTGGTLSLGNGLELRNLVIYNPNSYTNPTGLDDTVTYGIDGDLYATQSNFTGTGTGTLTIGYDY